MQYLNFIRSMMDAFVKERGNNKEALEGIEFIQAQLDKCTLSRIAYVADGVVILINFGNDILELKLGGQSKKSNQFTSLNYNSEGTQINTQSFELQINAEKK